MAPDLTHNPAHTCNAHWRRQAQLKSNLRRVTVCELMQPPRCNSPTAMLHKSGPRNRRTASQSRLYWYGPRSQMFCTLQAGPLNRSGPGLSFDISILEAVATAPGAATHCNLLRSNASDRRTRSGCDLPMEDKRGNKNNWHAFCKLPCTHCQ